MKLRVGWMILVIAVLVSFGGGFLPQWWAVGANVVAFAMAVGVVAADVKAIRRSKAKGGTIGAAKFFENASRRGDVGPIRLSPGGHFASKEDMEDYVNIYPQGVDLGSVVFDQPPLTDEQVQAFKEEWTKRYGTKDGE